MTAIRDFDRLLSDERGVSLVEILVSLLILVVGVIGITGLLYTSSIQAREGNRDTEVWAVAIQKMEALRAEGYGNITDGGETIDELPVTWEITGTNPEHVILVVQGGSRFPAMAPDTFVTYLHDPSP